MPLIATGQAQKEATHNEALALLDIAVQAAVEGLGLDSPPPAPEPGQCWIIGDAPTGVWAGQALALAGWTPSGWRFVAPRAGMAVWLSDEGRVARFDGAAWVDGVARLVCVEIGGEQVVAARQPGIVAPSGGATIDAEARAAITSLVNALAAHGLIALAA